MSEDSNLQKEFMICVGNPIPLDLSNIDDKRMRLDSITGSALVAEIESQELLVRSMSLTRIYEHNRTTSYLNRARGEFDGQDLFADEIDAEFDGVHSVQIANLHNIANDGVYTSFVPFKIKRLHSYSP